MTTPRRRRSCPRRKPGHAGTRPRGRGRRDRRHRGADDDAERLTRAYNRDLQRATPHAWETVDAVTEASEVAAGAVATADWNEEPSRRKPASFSTATGVADLLAANGLPFRTARTNWSPSPPNVGADYDAPRAAAQEVLGESLEAHVDPVAVADAALDPAEASRAATRGGPHPRRSLPSSSRPARRSQPLRKRSRPRATRSRRHTRRSVRR